MKEKKIKKDRSKLALALLSVGAALVVGVNIALFGPLSKVLDAFFVGAGGDVASRAQVKEEAIAVAKEIEAEGCVLLKNENGALPLRAGGKVNVLGYRSADIVYGGSGSGSVDSSKGVKLIDALKAKGFEPNPELIKLYGNGSGGGANGGVGAADFSIRELPLSSYTGNLSMNQLKAYSDVAVLVFGRNGGEGSDLPMTGYGADATESYLALSTEEEALVRAATETFSTVVVLLNAANPMELGFLEKYGVDACLWMGDPGAYGNESVAAILKGEINPSGKTEDTYALRGADAPAAKNFGSYRYANADGYYVHYAEGIYVGYKWYETAYAEGFYTDETYAQTVAYPFGYGLSYTTFETRLTGGTADGTIVSGNDEITIEAEVSNTGDEDGKEVVEVYYTPPYTEGGIEKAAVNLVAMQKTPSLAAHTGSQTVTLSFRAEDMASYDPSANGGEGAYVLEAGEYVISLRSDAHTVVDSVSVRVESDVTFSGEQKRSDDQTAAKNLFADVKGNGTYLSRAGGFSNYAAAMTAPSNVADADTGTALSTGYKTYEEDYTGEKPTMGASNGVTLAEMRSLPYDDPKWNLLLDQMRISEYKDLIGYGGYGTTAIASIDKKATVDTDGPCGISYYMNSGSFDCVSYPCQTVLGCSWNEDLAARYGAAVGKEARAWGVNGWYAPGMNIHRNAFCGRTYEYFSEDAVLSAMLSAAEVKAAVESGLIVYAKHFALNEQETVRDKKLCVWADEQSMREIYLLPFEASVKEGKSNGIMTSYSLIGNRWAGARSDLNNDLLRGEWGFLGIVVTDYNGYDYMNPDAAIHGGNDLMLSTLGKRPEKSTADSVYYMRKAAHNILYTVVNSNAYDSAIDERSGIGWRTVAIVADVAAGLLLAAGFAVTIVKIVKRKNKDGV